ncbi:hypothetical protein EPA93_01695 [Ktedonosporobacter rubrisoli]|uniref:XRE family transcriptional regulator n=1 Tax=Ktedonosporobacter rubrisoli TaxID=2509675 RepID=A0A4P6JIG8_KTERU|nr:hypothetical protein [Ktedonosporobacter rubrisoli]QBD74773.1 hypothetical protein EPA93_01695 [Ktedonosporobacter rubrisoli]
MKLNFYQLMQWSHNVSLLALARESNRHPFIVWDMLLKHPIHRGNACIILCAFNDLAGTSYTPDQLELVYDEGQQ